MFWLPADSGSEALSSSVFSDDPSSDDPTAPGSSIHDNDNREDYTPPSPDFSLSSLTSLSSDSSDCEGHGRHAGEGSSTCSTLTPLDSELSDSQPIQRSSRHRVFMGAQNHPSAILFQSRSYLNHSSGPGDDGLNLFEPNMLPGPIMCPWDFSTNVDVDSHDLCDHHYRQRNIRLP